MTVHQLGKRACGVLLPVFSLSSPYGIGTFSKEAYAFVDFLRDAGQSYWQVLPMGPTSYGDSPYQSFSTFAGNPYLIDPETLVTEGLLDRRSLSRNGPGNDGRIDYAGLYRTRPALLRKAYEASGLSRVDPFPDGGGAGKRTVNRAGAAAKPDGADSMAQAYRAFCKKNRFWLADYALFMALKDARHGASWLSWEEPLRMRKRAALQRAQKDCAKETGFYCFVQFLFDIQWKRLKAYANENGIEIIGDLPIYVAMDSADTWANPSLFQLDRERRPVAVAGCPPDDYALTGQLWGNPLYDWKRHAETGYAWWNRRLRHALNQVDVVRIDHFRGFESYYAIPAGDPTAEFGCWEKGPGYALFEALEKANPGCRVIAENLGFLTPAVYRLLKKTGYPGMKVLQFAFYPDENGLFLSDYLPYRYEKNCVVYTGTHDNDTTRGWYRTLGAKERAFLRTYLDTDAGTATGKKGRAKTPVRDLPSAREEKAVTDALIRTALASVADTAVIPLQDYLRLDGRARINTPSVLGGNWMWRTDKGALTPALAKRMRELAVTYGRV